MAIERVLCLDLLTAGLVIGWLEILFGLLEATESLLSIIYFEEYYAKINEEIKTGRKCLQYTLFFVFVVCLLDLITSIMLVWGIRRKSHKMILPWLGMKGFELSLLIPLSFGFIIIGLYFYSNGGDGADILVKSLLLAILVVFYCNLYIIVYSIYLFLRDESRKPHEINPDGLYAHYNDSTTIQFHQI